MDFQLDPDIQTATDSFRRYLLRDVAPLAVEYRDRVMPAEVVRAHLKALRPFGLISGWTRPEHGGQGVDYMTSGLMYEQLARVFPDLAGTAFIAEAAGVILSELGSQEVREKYLQKVLDGEMLGCMAITEPGAGSNPREVRAKAVQEGKGWRISGSKAWISNGGVSDFCIVVARTGDNSFTRFLVDRKEHGYRSSEIKKMGLTAWSTAEMYFDDVWVPNENIVGGLHEGLKSTMLGFQRGRVFMALIALAICEESLDAATTYARERTQFEVAIASHQLVQDMIAEIATLTETTRLLTYKALQRLSLGLPNRLESAMAKQYAVESAAKAAALAMSVHGANGIAVEFPVERHLRNARMLIVPDGTTQVNRLIMGRELLGVSAL